MNSRHVEFRDIIGFSGYRAGSDGSIWSRWDKIYPGFGGGNFPVLGAVWHQLIPHVNRNGYLRVSLRKDNRSHYFTIHKLVLLAFSGPPPVGMVARHLDGVKAHNGLENLRWGTRRENWEDSKLHGTADLSRAQFKLSDEQIREIVTVGKGGGLSGVLGRRFGVHPQTIRYHLGKARRQ